MNARARKLRTPIPVLFALCASVGTYACGASPPEGPPPVSTTPPDGGLTTEAGVDAGSVVLPEAGATDGSMADASMTDGSSPDGGLNDGGTPEAGTPEAGACAPGTADCDHDPSNGCESTLSSDPKNCSACGHDCNALPNVSGTGVTCNDGMCDVPASACTSGYGHCSSNPNDGCEANLGSAQTCGSCTTQCSGTTPDCSMGSCTDGCSPATLTSCSGSCVDTTSSSANCGGCGNACPIPANGAASCAMSTCTSSCNGGFHSCDNGVTCSDNGQPATCGSSCTPCPAPTGGSATCSGNGATATCGFSCPAGTHSCDNGATCSSDGNTATCGSSCSPCQGPVAGTGTTTCDGTNCGITCAAGSHLCGSNSCDSDMSALSCGSSCTPCSVLPGTAGANCNAQESCDYTTCLPGYADCDGDRTNGCEVNLSDNGADCGSCGHSCLGGTCNASACQPVVLASVAAPSEIVVDSTNVYFVFGQQATELGAVAKTGGAVRHALASSFIYTISTYGGYVFGRNDDGQVWVIEASAINGQDVSVQVTDTPGDNFSSTLIAAGPNVTTWIDPADDALKFNRPVGGVGTAVELFGSTGAISLLAVAPDGFLAWYDAGIADLRGGLPTEVGQTNSYSLTPSTYVLFAANATVTAVAADATYVYAAAGADVAAVTRVHDLSSGDCHIAGVTNLVDLAPDGTNVYAIETAPTRQIQKISGMPGFSATSSVVWTDAAIDHLAADATALYWTDSSTGKVMMLAK